MMHSLIRPKRSLLIVLFCTWWGSHADTLWIFLIPCNLTNSLQFPPHFTVPTPPTSCCRIYGRLGLVILDYGSEVFAVNYLRISEVIENQEHNDPFLYFAAVVVISKSVGVCVCVSACVFPCSHLLSLTLIQ